TPKRAPHRFPAMQRATMLLLCLALLAHQEPAPGEGFALTILLLLVSHRTQLEELQDVLEKLQSKRISTWKKKYNQVPKCFIGQACAVKKGARIGRLCDCPRGATCNSFLLRCL
uniref:Cocaine- and amphetamine-regulated transcript protein n=1 Tax=Gopherus evgoodei TaxID=1825980 RepID=A0A8C5EY14_9SAUR